MESFERIKVDNCTYGYFKTHKLKNNQTASIYFIQEELSKGTEYCVVFAIANKKKHIKQWITGERDALSYKETGTCGLEGLIWAKQQILFFEEFIKTKRDNVTICISWADNRRRNVYERALSKYGYKISYRYSSKYISKKIS